MTDQGEASLIVPVLTMHRSGSSALTKGLSVLGLPLGHDLHSAKVGDNDKGFFESREVTRLNERVLAKMGRRWHSVSLADTSGLAGPAFAAERGEAAQMLSRNLSLAPRFAFKDPRAVIVAPFWQAVIDAMSVESAFVIAYRRPMEVASSLRARDGFPLEKGLLLWATHMTAALEHVAGRTAVVVAFDELASDPMRQLDRVARTLGLPGPKGRAEAEAYCRDFIERDLYRNVSTQAELERFGFDFAPLASLDGILRTASRQDGGGPLRLDAEALETARRSLASARPLLGFIERLDTEVTGGAPALSAERGKAEAAAANAVRAADDARRERDEARAEAATAARTADTVRRERDGARVEARELLVANRLLRADAAENGSATTGNTLQGRLQRLVKRRAVSDFAALFDEDYYERLYAERFGPGETPLDHYRTRGWAEGCLPCPLFDPEYYLRANEDVASSGAEPLWHFVNHGWREGRRPHEDFDPAYYLARYQDVAAADVNPLIHYVRSGRAEGRRPRPARHDGRRPTGRTGTSDGDVRPLALSETPAGAPG